MVFRCAMSIDDIEIDEHISTILAELRTNPAITEVMIDQDGNYRCMPSANSSATQHNGNSLKRDRDSANDPSNAPSLKRLKSEPGLPPFGSPGVPSASTPNSIISGGYHWSNSVPSAPVIGSPLAGPPGSAVTSPYSVGGGQHSSSFGPSSVGHPASGASRYDPATPVTPQMNGNSPNATIPVHSSSSTDKNNQSGNLGNTSLGSNGGGVNGGYAQQQSVDCLSVAG